MVFNIWRIGGLYEPMQVTVAERKVPAAPEAPFAVQPLEKDILQEPNRFNPFFIEPERERQRSKNESSSSEMPTWKLQDDWVASQFMSMPVVTMPVNATLKDAWKVVIEKRYRHIPVVDEENRLIGVVSDRDLLKAAAKARKKEAVVPVGSLTVGEIMKQPAIAAQGDTLLVHIALIFIRKRIGCMPITDSMGHVIGILTRTDLLRAMLGVKKEKEIS